MKKILIVDSSAINKMIMRVLLEAMGHEVTELMACREAIARLDEESFDLIIADLESSEADASLPPGILLVQKARQCNKVMQVILAANRLTEEDEGFCLAYPPDAFLQRPFDQGYFRAVVGSTLVD